MAAAFGAIAPIFFLLLLGFGLGLRAFPGAGFWPMVERLVYVILFPALLIRSTAAIDPNGDIWRIAATVLLPILSVMTLGAFVGPRLGLGRQLIPAVAQAATRQNVYIAFAAAIAAWGDAALLPLGIAVAAYAPGVNLAGALLLGMNAQERLRAMAFVRALVLNPLVLACALGFALGLSRIELPAVLDEVLRILALASLPLALLATGAGLRWQGISAELGWLVGTAIFKLAGQPLLTLALGIALGLDGLTLAVVVLFAALPLSPTAYVQTRAMGGHALFMANAVALQTLASMVTLPFVLVLLKALVE